MVSPSLEHMSYRRHGLQGDQPLGSRRPLRPVAELHHRQRTSSTSRSRTSSSSTREQPAEREVVEGPRPLALDDVEPGEVAAERAAIADGFRHYLLQRRAA